MSVILKVLTGSLIEAATVNYVAFGGLFASMVLAISGAF